jgi:REP element-mobilizing transposase RayT
MRTARILGEEGSWYHCVSRIVDRQMRVSKDEKERFRNIMRRVEEFSGVRILTHSILDNHFHILLEVPERQKVSDEELLRRMRLLYAKEYVSQFALSLKECRKNGDNGAAEKLKERYTYRMYDLGEFMKTLKQRYTMSYNRRHERRGTLWEERFKSVLVDWSRSEKTKELSSSAAMAAYIDLNSVRAGIVSDPKEYRYSGYGEAVGGSKKAREGLMKVMGTLGCGGSWEEVSRAYRKLLYIRGKGTEKRPGFVAEEVKKVLKAGGKLSVGEALRCRVRYFSDGVALGSREYVNGVFEKHRERFGAKRKDGARALRHGEWGGLCALRDLRLSVVTVPE